MHRRHDDETMGCGGVVPINCHYLLRTGAIVIPLKQEREKEPLFRRQATHGECPIKAASSSGVAEAAAAGAVHY